MLYNQKATNQQLIESYRRTCSYTLTAKELNLSVNAVRVRITTLRLKGEDLPANKPRGWHLQNHEQSRKSQG